MEISGYHSEISTAFVKSLRRSHARLWVHFPTGHEINFDIDWFEWNDDYGQLEKLAKKVEQRILASDDRLTAENARRLPLNPLLWNRLQAAQGRKFVPCL